MALIALPTARLTLVSLMGDDRSPLLSRLLQASALREARHVAVASETAGQRDITASRIDRAVY